jgi:hypothetical protein
MKDSENSTLKTNLSSLTFSAINVTAFGGKFVWYPQQNVHCVGLSVRLQVVQVSDLYQCKHT